MSLANNAADFGTAGAAAHFSRLKWGSVDRHPRKNVDKFGEGMGAERGRKRERGGGGGKIRRSFTGMSEEREDGREGAWHCARMIGCDGSEAFTRIYECLF